jgi:hypothetical protein
MKKFIVLSCICLAVAAGNYSRAQSVLCGGTERWSVKVLTDAAVSTINFTPVITTLDSLINLPTPVPTFSNPRIAGIENKVYTIRCHITIKKFESDYDYHLVLSDDNGQTLIAESPDPVCSVASSSAYVNNFIAVRNFIDAHIPFGNVYNVNLPDVDVTGVAFVDLEHGQTGVAPNNIEIHPMLNIQFALVGIDELKEEILHVEVSPNPSRGNIHVNVFSKLNNLQKCSIQFFNTSASMVAECPLLETNRNTISEIITPDLPPGTYIYRIKSGSKMIYDGKLMRE